MSGINERDVTRLTIFLPRDRRKKTQILVEVEGVFHHVPLAMSSPVAKLILVLLQFIVNWMNANHKGQLDE